MQSVDGTSRLDPSRAKQGLEPGGVIAITTPRYSVPALEKGLEILELLASEPNGITVSAMATRLDRSTGELYRIVQYLEFRGYINRDRDRDLYSLSFKLFQLSHEHPPIRGLVVSAAPLMEQLAARIGQGCHLCVRDRTDVAIVAQVDSPLPIRYSVRLGASFPLWETSSGLMLCAFLRPAERSALDSKIREIAGPGAMKLFEAQIGEINDRGFELRESQMIQGITNISFAIHNHLGDPVAALTVPFLPQRSNICSLEEAIDALRQTSVAISAELGAGLSDTSVTA